MSTELSAAAPANAGAEPPKYRMTISLNVLNHLGLYLYSNTPAVLSEVIANAWDADAKTVRVDFDLDAKTITITDDGHGMSQQDINDKYLYVGFEKRAAGGALTPAGRPPMGRKGIGKLSLFSIANEFSVFSRKRDCEDQALLMDAEALKKAIQQDDPSSPGVYEPTPTPFDAAIEQHGTSIRIRRLKKVRLTRGTIAALRKRIARRFAICGGLQGFRIVIEGDDVTVADRGYFHKARFLFQYGDYDYAQHCSNLDADGETDDKLAFARCSRFDAQGKACADGEYEVRGWIGIARHSNDLDGSGKDDNLNKITVVVRGKVALEDILQEFRLGGMITKYIYGEINADFLDDDDEDDIATSSRQSLSVDDPRYIALRSFIGEELRHIWNRTNRLKDKKGLEQALSSNPHIREWYNGLRPHSLKDSAKKVFATIDKASVDEAHKQQLYADGILAFETLKMSHALDRLEKVDAEHLDFFLDYLADVDSIEAARYFEIVQERLDVIHKFHGKVAEDVLERILQEYVFDHLWLFDPSWERATSHQHMEERLQAVVGGVRTDSTVRVDIRYRRISGAHVIIELKRASRVLSKTEIESQIRKYIDALRKEIEKNPNEARYPIEAVCLVGRLPRGWNNAETRKLDEDGLRPYGIRVMTYQELIDNSVAAYSKFVDASESVGRLRELIDKIRAYRPE